MSDDPNKFKIRKLQAEILGLGSVIRQLRQPGMHDAATELLLCRNRAGLECLMRRTPWKIDLPSDDLLRRGFCQLDLR